MSNTGNTQQIIDYGATANDGTGDPLRTAFIKTDENFSNIWLAGPVGSNITIANNTIQTNNTNGNLVLKPNGTGVVQSNAAVVPNTSNVRDIGTTSLRWRAAYVGVGGVDCAGNITVSTVVASSIETTSISSDDSTQITIANDVRMLASADVDQDLTVGQALYLTPATKLANSPGVAGEIAVDANYIYVCVAANTWKRASLTAF